MSIPVVRVNLANHLSSGRAARNSHEGIVKLLLGRKDVNPDSSCESGRILLSSAATDGH